MNKQTAGVLVICLLVVGAFGWYFFYGPGSKPAVADTKAAGGSDIPLLPGTNPAGGKSAPTRPPGERNRAAARKNVAGGTGNRTTKSAETPPVYTGDDIAGKRGAPDHSAQPMEEYTTWPQKFHICSPRSLPFRVEKLPWVPNASCVVVGGQLTSDNRLCVHKTTIAKFIEAAQGNIFFTWMRRRLPEPEEDSNGFWCASTVQ